MYQRRNKGSPAMGRTFCSQAHAPGVVGCLIAVALTGGCASKGWTIAEVRGKNQFGPEFQHDEAKNTDQIRWYAGQGVEIKWDNGWTTGATYRYRKVQEGNGNTENLALLEVGYPIWKKTPKKPADKSAERIDALEKQLQELRGTLAQKSSENAGLLEPGKQDTETQQLAAAGDASGQRSKEKENDHEKP